MRSISPLAFSRWYRRSSDSQPLKLQIHRDESFENSTEIGDIRSTRNVSTRCRGQKVSTEGNHAFRWVFVCGLVNLRAGIPSTATPNPRTTNSGSLFAKGSVVLVAEMMSFGYTCRSGLWASCSESVVFWKIIFQTSVRSHSEQDRADVNQVSNLNTGIVCRADA